MENIKNFRKVRYYQGTRELTKEELIPLGLANDVYQTLEERAYQSAYDISNDWAKEVPEWKDVEEGFKKGVGEGIDYMTEKLKVFYNELIIRENDLERISYKEAYRDIINLFQKIIKED